jgi:hypothetical protein
MKGLAFLVLLGLLAFTILLMQDGKKEGFTANPYPQVTVPPVKPNYTAVDVSSPAPFNPPTEMAYGPAYGEIARINTLPYRNPALEPANFQQIRETLEDLNGFLVYEAKSLQERSDPAIQLPLTNARSDKNRLESEASVLARNPGIPSQLTRQDLDGVQANLAYLQRTFRLSVNQGAPVEGFTDGSGTTTDGPSSDGERATLNELEQARQKITEEVTRLSSSGTTDGVTQARIASLQKIGNDLDTIIREVKNGTRPAADIPVLQKDLKTFLPILGDVNQPIPKLIDEAGLPLSLSNLFPAYGTGDISGARVAQYLFKNYADTVVNGISWGLTAKLNYTSPRSAEIARNVAAAASTAGAEVSNESPLPTQTMFQFGTAPRGELEEVTQDIQQRQIGSRAVPQPPLTSGIDWKAKTAMICDAIRKRGLNPGDFGCVKNMNGYSDSYSWRGHARMVCQRLLTTPDPGLPELCGCPPLNWPGWKA